MGVAIIIIIIYSTCYHQLYRFASSKTAHSMHQPSYITLAVFQACCAPARCTLLDTCVFGLLCDSSHTYCYYCIIQELIFCLIPASNARKYISLYFLHLFSNFIKLAPVLFTPVQLMYMYHSKFIEYLALSEVYFIASIE